MIIIHGFLGALDNWRAMSKRLSEHYRDYSVDLRNHGRSPHSEVMYYPVMAHDLNNSSTSTASRPTDAEA